MTEPAWLRRPRDVPPRSLPRYVPTAEARRRLADLIDDAVAGTPTVVCRNGRPVAVIVAVGWWETAKSLLNGGSGQT